MGPLLGWLFLLAPPVALLTGLVGLWRDRRRAWAIVSSIIAFLTLSLMAVTWWMGRGAESRWRAERLDSFRREYVEKEGFAKRGPRFEQYVLLLDSEKDFPPTMKDDELLRLLGPPDRWLGDESDRCYLYRYTSAANGPSEVVVDVRKDIVWSYGYTGQGINDHSDWRDFKQDPPPKVADPPGQE